MTSGLIDISASWPSQTLGPGIEYYAFRLRVSHALGTGDGACEGCCQPMTAYLSTGYVTRSSGATIGLQPDTHAVVWNETGCPATPTHRTTWGLIKGLYR
jgi:hypothetical protein